MATKIKCEKCGETLKTIKYLELSNTDGNYYETIPKGHISQGSFPFGTACATAQLRETIKNIKPLPTPVGELPEQLEVKNGYRNEPKIYGGRQYLSEYEVVGKSGGLHLYAAIPADGAVEKRFAEELVKRYNAYPELNQQLETGANQYGKAIADNFQLQEQNRVLAEMLKSARKCIKELETALNSLTK